MMFTVVNMFFGCSSENVTDTTRLYNSVISDQNGNLYEPEPESDYLYVDLPMTRVFVDGFSRDSISESINVSYHYSSEGNLCLRKMNLSILTGYYVGFEVLITDTEDNMILSWSTTVDTVNYTSYITEKTPYDSLTVIHHEFNDTTNEQYYYNNSEYSVTFTENEFNEFLEWYDQIEKKDEDDFDKFTDFIDFYPEESSLNNNTDGFIMVYLFDDDSFTNWLENNIGFYKEQAVINTKSVEDICKIACATATVKCIFGGFLLNFVCHAAVGTCTACIIYWILT